MSDHTIIDKLSAAPDGCPHETQPAWRRDFPIDLGQDAYVARRDFTKFMVLISGAFATGQLWILAQSLLRSRREAPAALEIARIDEIAVNEARVFSYPKEHDICLLVRTGEATFVAFSQKCTHLSCAVIAEPEKGRFICPCHNGSFDMASGRPLAGPPPRPLPRITLEIRNGSIFATGVEVSTV